MAELSVLICTHHFVVRQVSPRARPAVEAFAKRYVQYGLVRERGRYFRSALRVFAAATQNRSEYRFHINTLKDFRQHLELPDFLLKGDLVAWDEAVIPEAQDVELPIYEKWETRDYQLPVVEYMQDPAPPRSKFVDLQTGKGKSYCAMRAISNIGKRAAIIVRPAYIEKWLIDLEKTYDIDIQEEVLVVQGSAQLQALLAMMEAGSFEEVKIILLSNKTLQNWIKLYEEFGEGTLDLGYACTPYQLFEHLKVGFRLIDEVHQDFHLNFKIDLYTHIARSGSLSATLVSDDGFISNMYELAYPAAQRYRGPAYDRYIDARAVFYRLEDPNRVRTTEYGSKSYSHHAVEKSLIRSDKMLNNYFDLINTVIKGTYLQNYKPGDRLLVYGASIDFCTRLTQYLKDQYPTLDVRRYVENDPYGNLMEADIRVSTIQSAGTGIDILNLTTVILTVAVSSSAANIQGFGRLRKLPDGTTPQFLYFVCQDIPKHMKYHVAKRDLLQARALVYKEETIPKFV